MDTDNWVFWKRFGATIAVAMWLLGAACGGEAPTVAYMTARSAVGGRCPDCPTSGTIQGSFTVELDDPAGVSEQGNLRVVLEGETTETTLVLAFDAHGVAYGYADDPIEKIAHLDLVDRSPPVTGVEVVLGEP